MKTIQAELVALIDASGDYAVGRDEAEAIENYENQTQALADSGGHRFVKVTLTVPLPELVELTGTVPGSDKVLLKVS